MGFLRLLEACSQCTSGDAHRLTESCDNTDNTTDAQRAKLLGLVAGITDLVEGKD